MKPGRCPAAIAGHQDSPCALYFHGSRHFPALKQRSELRDGVGMRGDRAVNRNSALNRSTLKSRLKAQSFFPFHIFLTSPKLNANQPSLPYIRRGQRYLRCKRIRWDNAASKYRLAFGGLAYSHSPGATTQNRRLKPIDQPVWSGSAQAGKNFFMPQVIQAKERIDNTCVGVRDPRHANVRETLQRFVGALVESQICLSYPVELLERRVQFRASSFCGN
jgi:hypothetical protein